VPSLESAGLNDINVITNKISIKDEIKSLFKYVGFRDTVGMLFGFIRLYIARPADRRLIKEMFVKPKGIIDYIGHGIYAGRK